jgi:hypothetical protein
VGYLGKLRRCSAWIPRVPARQSRPPQQLGQLGLVHGQVPAGLDGEQAGHRERVVDAELVAVEDPDRQRQVTGSLVPGLASHALWSLLMFLYIPGLGP